MSRSYRIASPNDDYRQLGTFVELDSESWYLVTPATNQPDPEGKWFVVYAGQGDWEIDYDDLEMCLGFMLEDDDLEFHDETFDEDQLDDAFDVLHQLNK